MIEYRSFRNGDPPHIAAIWNASRLGPNAADTLSSETFEFTNYAQTYFDSNGLIVACSEGRIIGFTHAGFAVNADETALDTTHGVICMVLVHPDFRQQQIGQELVRRAEAYLINSGVQKISAGPSPSRDPFYVGLYGGVQPAGFLDSETHTAPFFASLGYSPYERNLIFWRNIAGANPPMNFKLMSIRRKTQLAVVEGPQNRSWWWHARYGRLDNIQFALATKETMEPLAVVTVIGLDFYIERWRQRAVGLIDLKILAPDQPPEYGETLLVEIGKRLREELVTRVEIHTREDDTVLRSQVESAGFEQVTAGTTFEKIVA